MTGTEFIVFPYREALARCVADWLATLTRAKDDSFAVALSGGTTPRRLYELLAEPPWRHALPWERIHWFWGDERFVPKNDVRSNYRMVYEALLSRAPIPAANIHPIPTENSTPEAAADAYARTLASFYGAARLDPARPLFDVTLLGLGYDGHTASLFPETAALAERAHWVAAVRDAAPEPRVTLTFPALESSRHVAFLVAGQEKRDILERLRRGDHTFPAARLRPVGALHWFADATAAGPPLEISLGCPSLAEAAGDKERDMTQKRVLLEVGSGNDWHGRDYTKAALRAVQDAIHHCSLTMLKTLDIDPSEMLVEVTIGVQRPEEVDRASIAKALPDGRVTVNVVRGGLDVLNTDSSDLTVTADAAITVWLNLTKSNGPNAGGG